MNDLFNFLWCLIIDRLYPKHGVFSYFNQLYNLVYSLHKSLFVLFVYHNVYLSFIFNFNHKLQRCYRPRNICLKITFIIDVFSVPENHPKLQRCYSIAMVWFIGIWVRTTFRNLHWFNMWNDRTVLKILFIYYFICICLSSRPYGYWTMVVEMGNHLRCKTIAAFVFVMTCLIYHV